MGTVNRRECLTYIIVPRKYWTTTMSNIDLLKKEENGKTNKRNKSI